MKTWLLEKSHLFHWKWLVAFSVMLALMAGSFIFIVERKRSKARYDLRLIEAISTELQAEKTLSSETFQTARSLLERYPRLRASWDLPLTLAAFIQNDPAQGAFFAKEAFSEKPFVHPWVRIFSAVGLLIESGKIGEAIQAAEALEEKWHDKPEFAILRTYNLLRLACLQNDVKRFNELQKTAEFLPLKALFQSGSLSIEALFPQSS